MFLTSGWHSFRPSPRIFSQFWIRKGILPESSYFRELEGSLVKYLKNSPRCCFVGCFLKLWILVKLGAQKVAREGKWDPLFQGNLGWWNIIPFGNIFVSFVLVARILFASLQAMKHLYPCFWQQVSIVPQHWLCSLSLSFTRRFSIFWKGWKQTISEAYI